MERSSRSSIAARRSPFSHRAESRLAYTLPTTKRKLSVAKLNQNRQGDLSQEWKYLMSLALHEVREYFRAGNDGKAIPPTFQVKTDPYSRGLNNYSAQFWRGANVDGI
jgi:hypothetical protein